MNWGLVDYEAPAIGSRGYTNDVHLRGRRGYLGMESSTRGGWFRLCRRGFNRRVSGFLNKIESSTREEAPAIGNRGYTNNVHLRGRRGYLGMESSTRGGGFRLCRRGFNRRVSGFLNKIESSTREEAPAIGNRGYTNNVHLRGRKISNAVFASKTQFLPLGLFKIDRP